MGKNCPKCKRYYDNKSTIERFWHENQLDDCIRKEKK
jgi:hypothetical protein